jgi:(p)ppGpp synthase/HD superfamily hydrolase
MNTVDRHSAGQPMAPVLVMPLHAITEIHGESGLRQRLALELGQLPDRDGTSIAEAAHWAALLHAGQRRSREPYVNHVLRVTLRILCHYKVADPDILVAALLHDAVEDQHRRMVEGPTEHGPPSQERAFAVLATRFGPRVERLVRAVTNPDWQPGPDRNQQYVDHLAAALGDDPWARVVKLSDFTDNAVGIIHTVGPRLRHLARKYTLAVPLFRDLLARADTPLSPTVKAHINRQLDLADSRLYAVLKG